MSLFEPLKPPIIDPKNEKELVELALERVYIASNGRINDFSASSPARALIEGLSFAGAEMLYYANKVPEATVIKFLQVAGVMRRLGTAAQATLEVELIEPLSGPFILPEGFSVGTISGNLLFSTDSQLIIPIGSSHGTVTATCTEIGEKGNVAAETIAKPVQALAYLKSIFNPSPATGGTEDETIEEVKARGFEALRRRGLVSKADYEGEAKALLGVGSIALTRGNIGQNGTTKAAGNVHVFCLNSDGSELSDAQALTIRDSLRNKSLLTVADAVWVSSLKLQPLYIEAIAKIQPGANPTLVADKIWDRLKTYLALGKFSPGGTVALKELEYQVRLAGGVARVHSVALSEQYDATYTPINFPMPVPHAIPHLKAAIVILQGSVRDYRYVKGDIL